MLLSKYESANGCCLLHDKRKCQRQDSLTSPCTSDSPTFRLLRVPATHRILIPIVDIALPGHENISQLKAFFVSFLLHSNHQLSPLTAFNSSSIIASNTSKLPRLANHPFAKLQAATTIFNMSNLTSSTGMGQGTGNKTLLEFPQYCTLETCDLTMANFMYIPTLPGNAVVAALFGICIVGQLWFGIKNKTWGYMGAMVFGCILEIIAYVARIMLHNNPFNGDSFLMYLVTCTIAPALFTAAVSTTSTLQYLSDC